MSSACWTPPDAIQADLKLNYLEEDWRKYVAAYPQRQKDYEVPYAHWQEVSAQQKAEGKPLTEGRRAAQMTLKEKLLDQKSAITDVVIVYWQIHQDGQKQHGYDPWYNTHVQGNRVDAVAAKGHRRHCLN